MKKEIEQLLKSKKGYYRINEECTLKRRTQDGVRNKRDILEVEFEIPCFNETYDIKAREVKGIIEEIKFYMNVYYLKICQKRIKEFENGHLRQLIIEDTKILS